MQISLGKSKTCKARHTQKQSTFLSVAWHVPNLWVNWQRCWEHFVRKLQCFSIPGDFGSQDAEICRKNASDFRSIASDDWSQAA